MKLIPVKRAAEIAGRVGEDGKAKVGALRSWITRWNLDHPTQQVLTTHGHVDEASLRAAIRAQARRQTPGAGMAAELERLTFQPKGHRAAPARRAA